MKNLKLLFLFIAIFLVHYSFAQSKIDLSKHNCYSATVKYQIDGDQQEGILMFINYRDSEGSGFNYATAFVLGKGGQNYKIIDDSLAFTGVYDIKVSENQKYLAIFKVGEGHPWIEIYDLQKLITQKVQDFICDVNPYPGNINMIGWQNNLLIIESDMDFLLKNDNKELSDKDLDTKFKKYSFNLTDKKFKILK